MQPVATEKENGYALHKLGREIVVQATNIPLLILNAAGQYRTNYALYQSNRRDPLFQGWSSHLYRPETAPGKRAQRFFIPKSFRGAPLSAEEAPLLRRSGARMQGLASSGLQIQPLLRLGPNLMALYALASEEKGDALQKASVLMDSAAIVSNMTDAGIYAMGLHRIHRGMDSTATTLLMRSHRVNILSNGIQITAGLSRLYTELELYRTTGEINGAVITYAALDTANGASGIAYSGLVLKEAKATSQVIFKNNALTGLARLPASTQWILRGSGVIGAGIGLGANVYSFYEAAAGESETGKARHNKMIASGLGMAGSGLMLASALLLTPATAPLAGLLFVGALCFMVGQSIFSRFTAS